jgi:hypothetical protein
VHRLVRPSPTLLLTTYQPTYLPTYLGKVPYDVAERLTSECLFWDVYRTGGQIKNDDCADDIRFVDLTKVHYLSGPFEVEGAEPGDMLLVEIMDVQPLEDQPWGFTGIFDRRNGVSWFFPLWFRVGRRIVDDGEKRVGVDDDDGGEVMMMADGHVHRTGRVPRRNLPLRVGSFFSLSPSLRSLVAT